MPRAVFRDGGGRRDEREQDDRRRGGGGGDEREERVDRDALELLVEIFLHRARAEGGPDGLDVALGVDEDAACVSAVGVGVSLVVVDAA